MTTFKDCDPASCTWNAYSCSDDMTAQMAADMAGAGVGSNSEESASVGVTQNNIVAEATQNNIVTGITQINIVTETTQNNIVAGAT